METPLDGSEVTGADLWLPGFGPQEDPLLIEKLDSVQGNSAAVLSPAPAEEPKQSRCWELLTPSVFTDLNGEVTKFHANLKAIRNHTSPIHNGLAHRHSLSDTHIGEQNTVLNQAVFLHVNIRKQN